MSKTKVLSKTADDSKNDLQKIISELKFCVGQKILLLIKSNRSKSCYFATLKSSGVGYYAEYYCYDEDYKFRCVQRITISPVEILTKSQIIVYLERNFGG